MKQRLRSVLPLAAAFALLAWSIHVRLGVSPPSPTATLWQDAPTGAVLVDLDDGAGPSVRARVAAALRAAIAPAAWPAGPRALGERLSEAAQLFRVRPPPQELADVLQRLASEEDVEGVEVERTWRLPEGPLQGQARLGSTSAPSQVRRGSGFRPNDPYYDHQWHLDQIGMPRAWARARGKGAIVAVVDTGVLYRTGGAAIQAPDLAETRFVGGYDFVDGDDYPDDEHGHGTHVAGTIAQSTHNHLGVAGVAPEAAIMPIRVLDQNGAGGWGAIAAGIRWATDHGAHVINLSLGGGMPSQTVRRAIDHAHRKGVLVVAAAGNASRPSVEYPAAHRHALAVGAVRFDGSLAFYSSYGRGLALVAPGGDLRVDQNGDGLPDGVLQNTMVRGDPSRHDYLAFQGTSMATPHVAGVAALLHGAGIRDPDALARILTESARKKSDRRRYGAGLLQADAALNAAGRDLGGLRGALALALAGFGLLLLRRRRALDVRGGAVLFSAFALAGGLAVLPWSWVPGVGVMASEASMGLASVLSVSWLDPLADWLALLWWSPLVPVGAVGLGLGLRRARPWLAGACAAFAACMVAEALVPTMAPALVPALLVGPWLLGQAAVTAWVGLLAAKRPV